MTILGFVTCGFSSALGSLHLLFALVCFFVEQLVINHHDSRKILGITETKCFVPQEDFIHASPQLYSSISEL